MLKEFHKAIASAEANIKTLNSKNLKATYNELLSAAKNLNEKAINRTVLAVIEEKTRYHAERIARTETVRAWFDGFIAENQDDNEVFGYRWVLSSRHKLVPFDQCDVCANMNVGYGKGIYPKNKVPSIPRHPHCMCMLEVVYTWEIDVNAPLNPDGAREYIDSLNEQRKNSLFGIDGAKAYKQGKDWQKLLRGWDGFGEPKSRLDKKDFIDNRLLPNYKQAIIPNAKIFDYALDQTGKGHDKAIVFQSALGYNKNNGIELINNIKENLPYFKRTDRESDEYGERFNVVMELKGPNGKTANILTAWIIDWGKTNPRLTTTYVVDNKEAIKFET